MISVEDAMDTILNNTKIKPTKKVSVDSATGYFLAEDVIATEPLPPFPASIKDGYAVQAEDGPGIYPVIGSVTAGAIPPFKVTKGTIARITTGSAVPEGADAVVMVEDTILLPKDESGVEKVKIEVSVSKWADIRPIGCDVPLGQTILKAGDRLGPPEIGLLATLGIQEVSVFELPKVAILSTGDELALHTAARDTVQKGMIRDSNRPMLFSAIRSVDPNWAESIVDLGIAKDNMEDLEKRVTKGINEADVVITSGGVSMGELDLLKPLLERLGKIHFGRVEMKPGKPLTFATVNDKIIFSLPGNPVSSLVTFYLFVLPALRKLSGQPASSFNPPSPLSPAIPSPNSFHHPYTTTIQARILGEIRMDSERRDYQRVALTWNDSARCFDAVITGVQASCRLLSMKSANGLAVIQKGAGVLPPGSIVQVLLTGTIL